jgi:FMN phosphatase YigB (HAD superfamily)
MADEVLFLDDRSENVLSAKDLGLHAAECKNDSKRIAHLIQHHL